MTKQGESSKRTGPGIYQANILTKTIHVPFNLIGQNLKDIIRKTITNTLSGKCIKEGYIKPGSIQIINNSAGIVRGSLVRFVVTFSCLICNPVEGHIFTVTVKNITKAGIRCEYLPTGGTPVSPVVVFIARDHHYINPKFHDIKSGSTVKVNVIGSRFELNDMYISIIAELV
jgi:DNA-directed RNA polymerase subunit E'/Rpb7